MASFFIRARPQNLPPFLLDLAEKTETTILPHHSFPPPIHNAQEHSLVHGKAPLPSSQRFLNPHPDRLFPQNKKGPENVPDLFT